jgi:hypothetical protein
LPWTKLEEKQIRRHRGHNDAWPDKSSVGMCTTALTISLLYGYSHTIKALNKALWEERKLPRSAETYTGKNQRKSEHETAHGYQHNVNSKRSPKFCKKSKSFTFNIVVIYRKGAIRRGPFI